MKRLGTLLLMLVLVLASSVAALSTAQAIETCYRINSKGMGHI